AGGFPSAPSRSQALGGPPPEPGLPARATHTRPRPRPSRTRSPRTWVRSTRRGDRFAPHSRRTGRPDDRAAPRPLPPAAVRTCAPSKMLLAAGPRDSSRVTRSTTYASWPPIGASAGMRRPDGSAPGSRVAVIDMGLHAPTIGRCTAQEHATDVRLPLEFRKKSAAHARGGLVKRSDARRGLTAPVVAAEQFAIADHRPAQNRGRADTVGELVTEQREQAVRVGHGRPDGRWVGTVGYVELRRD